MSLRSEQVQPKAVESQRFLDRAGVSMVRGVRRVRSSSVLAIAVHLRRPACGQTHRWKSRDAWITTNKHQIREPKLFTSS
jgi:hypothetical protein